VAKLAYDSAVLQRERMRYDETAEGAISEMQQMDRENRTLRNQVEDAVERAEMYERRFHDLSGKLAEAERGVQRLSLEEGCRERLVQAMRQLEEESEAKAVAEQQAMRQLEGESQAKAVAEQKVRGQMERIQLLTIERKDLLHDLQSDRPTY
ncbi:hypothetical protein T484DRAFT_1783333, partial [Baffinella frigidus]